MRSHTLIVNENDEIIGSGTREEIDAQHAWYRVAALRITNSKGEILLAQRALTKSHSPGKRGPAVAGTNDEGETYLANIIKEAKEELGLDITEEMLTVGPKLKNTGIHNYFTQRFFLTINKKIEEFITHKEEVMALRRISKADYIYELTNFPDHFTPNAAKSAKSLGLI